MKENSSIFFCYRINEASIRIGNSRYRTRLSEVGYRFEDVDLKISSQVLRCDSTQFESKSKVYQGVLSSVGLAD